MNLTNEKHATFTPSEEVQHEVHKLLLEHDEDFPSFEVGLSEYHIGIVSKIIGDNHDKLREVLAKVEGGEG